jgi:hypothetical protein
MMETEQPTRCWHFVMSSFARIYGVEEVHADEIFHWLALQWCDDHNYCCDVHLDDLKKVDVYFRKYFEENKECGQ